MGQLLTGNDNDVITTLLISTNNLFVYIISIVYFQVCLTESDAKHTMRYIAEFWVTHVIMSVAQILAE
jgi:hypothetical protein